MSRSSKIWHTVAGMMTGSFIVFLVYKYDINKVLSLLIGYSLGWVLLFLGKKLFLFLKRRGSFRRVVLFLLCLRYRDWVGKRIEFCLGQNHRGFGRYVSCEYFKDICFRFMVRDLNLLGWNAIGPIIFISIGSVKKSIKKV